MKEIILIDDEPLVNKIHTVLIRSAKADQILTSFTDPVNGFNYVKEHTGNRLVLLDINMPVMNAWNFLDGLRELDNNTDVIILSSSINPEDRIAAESYSNVKAFLNKPLSKENIRKIIGVGDLSTEWHAIKFE
ncbi:MAG: response regulator [Arcticibacter sp.]